MANLYSRSIRGKLIVLFTATASLAVLVACAALWVYQLVHYRTVLRNEESATAQLIADSSAPALLFNDSTAANETLSLLRADPRVQLACLYEKGGVPVAHFAALNSEAHCPPIEGVESRFTRKHLALVRPIEVDSEVVGHLYLEVGLSEMYGLLAGFAETGLFVLIMATAFALALSSVLERLISRPILQLTAIATQVSEGGNYLLRARRVSKDETGVLIDQFNLMMDRIQERELELQRAQNGLEDKVRERTQALRDEIAERKAIEHHLEIAKVAAEDSDRAKSAFLANMSHELRTPLNAIIGYSEMLHEDAAAEGLSSMTQDLDKVLLSARHLLTLISDILDLSKIEAGQMKVYLEPVLAESLLQEVMSTAEMLVKRHRNRLVIVQPVWRGVMLVDSQRFSQCLLNLISNSCKFTEAGTVTIAVGRESREDGDWILWSVRDTGIGISAEGKTKLFQTFSQVDPSATRKHGGSGLGLAISQELCRAMGGRITVESELGKGSTFTICIPHFDPDSPDPKADHTPDHTADHTADQALSATSL